MSKKAVQFFVIFKCKSEESKAALNKSAKKYRIEVIKINKNIGNHVFVHLYVYDYPEINTTTHLKKIFQAFLQENNSHIEGFYSIIEDSDVRYHVIDYCGIVDYKVIRYTDRTTKGSFKNKPLYNNSYCVWYNYLACIAKIDTKVSPYSMYLYLRNGQFVKERKP